MPQRSSRLVLILAHHLLHHPHQADGVERQDPIPLVGMVNQMVSYPASTNATSGPQPARRVGESDGGPKTPLNRHLRYNAANLIKVEWVENKKLVASGVSILEAVDARRGDKSL